MNCPKCGTPNNESASFCRLCYESFIPHDDSIESQALNDPQNNDDKSNWRSLKRYLMWGFLGGLVNVPLDVYLFSWLVNYSTHEIDVLVIPIFIYMVMISTIGGVAGFIYKSRAIGIRGIKIGAYSPIILIFSFIVLSPLYSKNFWGVALLFPIFLIGFVLPSFETFTKAFYMGLAALLGSLPAAIMFYYLPDLLIKWLGAPARDNELTIIGQIIFITSIAFTLGAGIWLSIGIAERRIERAATS